MFEKEVRTAFEVAPYSAEILAQLGMAITSTSQYGFVPQSYYGYSDWVQ